MIPEMRHWSQGKFATKFQRALLVPRLTATEHWRSSPHRPPKWLPPQPPLTPDHNLTNFFMNVADSAQAPPASPWWTIIKNKKEMTDHGGRFLLKRLDLKNKMKGVSI